MEKNFEHNAESEIGKDYIPFGEIARDQLGLQGQYASRYVHGRGEDYPNLGVGLRFIGNPDNYHTLKIHPEDVAEFVKRVKECKAAQR